MKPETSLYGRGIANWYTSFVVVADDKTCSGSGMGAVLVVLFTAFRGTTTSIKFVLVPA